MKEDQIAFNPSFHEIELILGSINRGIFGIDVFGNCTFINRAATEMLGYCHEQCIGENMHELIHSRFRNGEPYSEANCLICNSKENIVNKITDDEVFWKADGSSFSIRYSSNPIIDNGIFKGSVVTFSDITQQKQKEAALFESEKIYKHIFENNPSPMLIWDLDTLQILDCNIEASLKYGYSKEEFLKLNIRDIRPKEDIPLIISVAQKLRANCEVPKKTWRHKKKNGKLFHVEVTTHRIEYQGKQAALTLIYDVTEKLKAENKLKYSEEKLRTATMIARLGYWSVKPDGSGRYWSEEIYNIWGVSQDFDLSNDSIFRTVHPEDRDIIFQEKAACLAGKKEVSLQYRIILPDGSIKWVQETGQLTADRDSNELAFQGTVQDITTQKLLSLSLEEGNQRYQYVSKATSDAIWDWDLVKGTLFLGGGFELLFGHIVENNQSEMGFWASHLHPEDADAVITNISGVIEGGETNWAHEFRYQKADGSYAYISEKGFVIRDNKGQAIRMVGAMKDITQSKQHEADLLESNERFAIAARATAQAIWEWNAKEPQLFKEHGYKELFGYDLVGNTGDVSFWASKVHEEDYDAVWQQMEEARLNPEIFDWTIEYRFKRADDQYLFIKEKAILLRDQDGKLLRMIGSMHDITRRKKEERHLKLLESVITNTNDAVLITEGEPLEQPGPRIVYINEAFTRMSGYSSVEVIGQGPGFLLGPRSGKRELKRLNQALSQCQPCEITIINYKKDGEEYWVNLSVSPITDEKGKITHIIAIQKDVTHQKKAELELKLFAEELFKQNKELHQFGYIVSHNLRSPVANIMGIATLLELDKDDPETVETCTKDLKIAIHSLDAVIKDLSKILSITDGTMTLVKEKIELQELINNIKTDLKEAIEYSGADIQITLEPFFLFSNKAYLYSIFYNLISNSIKYRSEKAPLIKIDFVNNVQSVTISITDNGLGIDLDKHKEDLFKPYKRFNFSVDGKGLGLFLVKSHIEALKGKLFIESELQKGTVFKILLPNTNFEAESGLYSKNE